jgi:nucleotide-binding universal stress UspA family protein
MTKSNYTVVVGVDGSPSGIAALHWAVDEARCRGGRVIAVHAWVTPYDYSMEVVFPPDEERLRSDAQQRLDESVASVDATDVEVEAQLVEGNPQTVLLQAASGADLLVVGSHGHRALSELLLGSVSTACVHHAGCPVVVVHDRREAPDAATP